MKKYQIYHNCDVKKNKRSITEEMPTQTGCQVLTPPPLPSPRYHAICESNSTWKHKKTKVALYNQENGMSIFLKQYRHVMKIREKQFYR